MPEKPWARKGARLSALLLPKASRDPVCAVILRTVKQAVRWWERSSSISEHPCPSQESNRAGGELPTNTAEGEAVRAEGSPA